MRPRRPDSNDPDPPSGHLWVGNLPPDVNESDLSKVFGTYGVIDEITYYSNRTYAFIYFKRPEDASVAKRSLEGFLIKGSPIRIEFAKPAKPSKNVWVGGFGPSVTKEKLEEELSKFGKIEDLKFFREKNNAVVEFSHVEDASAAVNNINGLQIGVHRIRVDFLRSHGRREQSDFQDTGSVQFRGITSFDPSCNNSDFMRSYPEPAYLAHKRPQPSQSFGGDRVNQPSKVLWVRYPSSVIIDEEMLHNAMILYGEIESIKCFPLRHYSFVEFRSVEEARRAKEALQGRLFNDPRITIMFSNSDLPPLKDVGPVYPGYRTDIFGTEVPFRPPMMAPTGFPGPLAPNGSRGSGHPGPFGPRESLDPNHAHHGSNPSPRGSGLLPTPVPSRASRKTSGWDVLDPSQLPREPKRSRMDGPSSFDDNVAGTGRLYGADPQFVGGPFHRVHDGRLGAGKGSQRGDEDYIWRGVIAKGGSSVCHARCIPIGKGLECALPEFVNCSARTGLDMLTKHYASAIGFDIVFFLPDSEDDFANYTEFLRYLGSKNRAGVAKLDDGTTLFLVPPSEFLTDVLKVPGPERLYGVVLKLPHQQHHDYVAPIPKMDRPTPVDYGRTAAETVLPQMGPFSTGSVPLDQYNETVTSTSRPGLTLTPELIATLATLLPRAPTGQSVQSELSSSATVPSLPIQANDQGVMSNDWNQQVERNQLYSQPSTSFHAFPSNLQPNSHLVPSSHHENVQAQNPAYDLQDQLPRPYDIDGTMHGTNNFHQGAYGVTNIQQPGQLAPYPDQFHGENLSRGENVSGNMNGADKLQPVTSGVGEGPTEVEVEKNQRYQSTLQFAANLLLQIQQKQQQAGSHAGN